MRSLLACTAALALAHGSPQVDDEVVLLQSAKRQDPAGEQPFELICDPLQGCHYLVHSSPTPVPYQLVCDEKEGCKYTGVASPPKPAAPSSPFQTPDTGALLVLMATLANQAKQHLPAMPQTPPQMPQVPQLAAHLPQLPQLPQHLPQHQPGLPGPNGEQLAQWAREYEGAETGHLLKPNFTAAKWLFSMLKANPADEKAVAPTPEPQAFFIPDNLMCCVQGPAAYIREKLALLKESPLGSGYEKAAAIDGSCTGAGYDQGPGEEKCFPKAHLYLSKNHPIDPMSESIAMAKYAMVHGLAAAGEGMKQLCAH